MKGPRTIGIGMATRGRGSRWHRRDRLDCPHNMTPAADCMCRALRPSNALDNRYRNVFAGYFVLPKR